MIPSTVHRIWLGDPLPGVFARFGDRWRADGWQVVDWRDRSDLPPLHNQTLFDEAKARTSDWKRFEADVLRLELLFRFGGVYADMDVEPTGGLGQLRDASCFVARSPQHRHGVHPLTNAVMGAEPEHPFVGALIDRLPQSADEHAGEHIARSVGPWHVTRVFEDGDWSERVTILPYDEFYGPLVDHKWNTARRKRGQGLDR